MAQLIEDGMDDFIEYNDRNRGSYFNEVNDEDMLDTHKGISEARLLQCMSNIDSLYRSLGKYNEAEPLYKECLVKCEMTLGSNHPKTWISTNNAEGPLGLLGEEDNECADRLVRMG